MALRLAGRLNGEQVARLYAREPVDAVLADRDAAAATPTTSQATPAVTGSAVRIECRTWKLYSWYAAPQRPNTDPRLDELEGTGDTEDAALDDLGRKAMLAIGAPVLLVTPEDVAA
jgi:hypothetical protein